MPAKKKKIAIHKAAPKKKNSLVRLVEIIIGVVTVIAVVIGLVEKEKGKKRK